MSQDQDPIDETRQFEPVDPYNIPPEQQGYPAGYEQPQPFGADGGAARVGFRQRLARWGPLKVAALGTAGVIVLGGAAWGTTAAFQSSGSSNSAAATATGTDQSQAPGTGATTGGHRKMPKAARVTITQIGSGSFTGTAGKGKTVTVDYDAKTKFGTKAHPLTSAQLKVGMTVTVAGALQGDTITASAVIEPVRGGKKTDKTPKTPGATTPTDAASPVDGSA